MRMPVVRILRTWRFNLALRDQPLQCGDVVEAELAGPERLRIPPYDKHV